MSDDVIMMASIDDDDDSTVFQTDEDRQKLEKEIQQQGEDNSEVDITQQMKNKSRSYWQQVFG